MNLSSNTSQHCPACGANNACTLADPRTADKACWCFSVSIDPALIQALPDALRNTACLCPRCAGINDALADKPQP